MSEEAKPKTLIGVLASHDNAEKNRALAQIFEKAVGNDEERSVLGNYRFLFTGGTFDRLFSGKPSKDSASKEHALSSDVKKFLTEEHRAIALPSAEKGGVTILASLISQGKVSIIWPFLTPVTTHLHTPENQALLRLGDQWRAKRLMNTGSVAEWIKTEARRDQNLNLQKFPLELELPGSGFSKTVEPISNGSLIYHLDATPERFPDFSTARTARAWNRVRAALISHDEMKSRMLDFVIDYERELEGFAGILATGTTGGLVEDASPKLKAAGKVHRYHSGPKGGDIEIATEILYGRCHVVIFLVDPLHPHPHADDIRVVFGACMLHDEVRMLTNESQARSWMNRVVRRT